MYNILVYLLVVKLYKRSIRFFQRSLSVFFFLQTYKSKEMEDSLVVAIRKHSTASITRLEKELRVWDRGKNAFPSIFLMKTN